MSNQPRQKQYKSENGKEYTFQHPGVLNWVRNKDKMREKDGKPNEENLQKYVMENVIVQPKVSWDYWDEHLEDYEEVMQEATTFLRGLKLK
ncbi:hypothetical protein F9U64_01170 [Gracilibacillus oryzae]|uniref:Uncharacterized protein n=1 Tax=Gracilibacillus oryzae TaxID=1672701 RepID=A0A7C8L9T9_9BACI|nr:hypothetical protein [Gracilibacillus oryzae]KAB8139264.1 hypothetical protein F9U64_01170 [Gracilibacillus oryzae]